jgi:hypothetical protein
MQAARVDWEQKYATDESERGLAHAQDRLNEHRTRGDDAPQAQRKPHSKDHDVGRENSQCAPVTPTHRLDQREGDSLAEDELQDGDGSEERGQERLKDQDGEKNRSHATGMSFLP